MFQLSADLCAVATFTRYQIGFRPEPIHKMESYERIHHLFYNLVRGMFSLMGHDIFRGGIFEPGPHTYFMYTFYVSFFIGVGKTLTLFDRNLTLQIIAFLGLALGKIPYFLYHFLNELMKIFLLIWFFRVRNQNVCDQIFRPYNDRILRQNHQHLCSER